MNINLNQYFTKPIYSDALINYFDSCKPSHALDLGFGNGELLNAVKRRWNDVLLIGVDIDKSKVSSANLESCINAIQLDGLNPEIPNIIKDKYGEIDLLVSNPPYYSLPMNANSKAILKLIGMDSYISNKLKHIPAEIIFLAQNLRMLTSRGYLGIILPAGIISGEKWKKLRIFLISKYDIAECIQMPDNCFSKTEAQTFMLIIRNRLPKIDNLTKVSHFQYKDKFTLTNNEVIHRIDYLYYHQKKLKINRGNLTKNDFIIKRGNASNVFLKKHFTQYVHTTKIPNKSQILNLPYSPSEITCNVIKGDILVARVGRRCLGRIAIVKSGSLPVSDCIIILRAKNSLIRKKMWEIMCNKHTMITLQSYALGVGAKYITHSILSEYLLDV